MAIRILSSESISGFLTINTNDASGNRIGFKGDGATTGTAIHTNWTTGNSYLDFRLGGESDVYTKMRINNNGNVGIGTISPDAKLEVFAGASTTQDDILWGGIIRNNANSAVNTGYGAGLKLKVSSDTTGEVNKWAGIAGIAGSTFSNVTDLAFYANPTASNVPIELMRLTGEGNVGIGTDSPDSTLTLGNATGNVAELRVLRSNSLSTTYGFINTTGGTAQLGGSSDTRIIASTGRLLFNSNTRDQISLEANGEYRLKLGSNTTGYEASMDNTDSAYRIFGSRFGGTGKYVAIWSDGANENTRFYPSKTIFYQNVGIGTDSPSATTKLHIRNATSNSYATLRLEGANRGGIIEMYNQTSYPVSSIQTDQSGNTYFSTSGAFASTTLSAKMSILTGGNVGIGNTSPRDKLTVFTAGAAEEEIGLRLVNPVGFTNVGSGASIIFAQDRNTGENLPMAKIRSAQSIGGTSSYGDLIFSTLSSTMQDRMTIYSGGVVEVAGDLSVGGANKARFKSDGTNTYVDAIPANSEIRFRVAGAVEKFRIAASGATTQTMDSTTSLSHLWSQSIPLQNIWYTVYTYSQYDSVCFFAMVSFENDAGDGANQSAMFATSAGAAYGAAFGVQQISGGTGIEARRSSTSFQVRQTIGGYTSATRLNVRFVSIN